MSGDLHFLFDRAACFPGSDGPAILAHLDISMTAPNDPNAPTPEQSAGTPPAELPEATSEPKPEKSDAGAKVDSSKGSTGTGSGSLYTPIGCGLLLQAILLAVYFLFIYSPTGAAYVVNAAAELKCRPAVAQRDKKGAPKNDAGEDGKKEEKKKETLVPCDAFTDLKVWHVTGRVLMNGGPVKEATVWAVASDEDGNAYSPPAAKSGAEGEFEFDAIPFQLEGRAAPIKALRVYGVKEEPGRIWGTNVTTCPPFDLRLGSASTRSSPYQNSWLLAVPLVIFLASIVVCFLRDDSKWICARYYITYLLALAMTAAMVFIVGFNMAYFNSELANKGDEYQSIGFIHFFKGTFVKEAEPEWLVSFTARPEWYANALRQAKLERDAAMQANFEQPKGKADDKKVAVPKPGEKKGDAEPGKHADKKDAPAQAAGAKDQDKGHDNKNPPADKKGTPARAAGVKDQVKGQDEKDPPDDNGRRIRGFGAPFWVLFIAVFGSSLLVIILVIRGVVDPPRLPFSIPVEKGNVLSKEEEERAKHQEEENRKKFRDNMRTIIEHQFYLLFAPFSGIFVYQFLVLGEAAAHSTMVALTVLGAGLTLNVILARGVRLAEQLIKSPENQA